MVTLPRENRCSAIGGVFDDCLSRARDARLTLRPAHPGAAAWAGWGVSARGAARLGGRALLVAGLPGAVLGSRRRSGWSLAGAFVEWRADARAGFRRTRLGGRNEALSAHARAGERAWPGVVWGAAAPCGAAVVVRPHERAVSAATFTGAVSGRGWLAVAPRRSRPRRALVALAASRNAARVTARARVVSGHVSRLSGRVRTEMCYRATNYGAGAWVGAHTAGARRRQKRPCMARRATNGPSRGGCSRGWSGLVMRPQAWYRH
jgi:hypothetical protein